MKLLFYFLLLSSSCFMVAQETMEPSHYAFPEFSPGVIHMKNGQANRAFLNYNKLSKEMVFYDAGVKKAIADEQLNNIDSISIKNRKFFRLDGTFVELLYQSNSDLYAEYSCKVKAPENQTVFGQTTQTSANQTYSPRRSMGGVYDVKLPNGTKVIDHTSYWIKKDGKLHKVKSIKQLTKVYDNKKSSAKNYIKQHDVDFDNPQNITELVKFLEEK